LSFFSSSGFTLSAFTFFGSMRGGLLRLEGFGEGLLSGMANV
jgi:hypothetical protein